MATREELPRVLEVQKFAAARQEEVRKCLTKWIRISSDSGFDRGWFTADQGLISCSEVS